MRFVNHIFFGLVLLSVLTKSQKSMAQENGEFFEFGPYRLKLQKPPGVVPIAETWDSTGKYGYQAWLFSLGSDTLQVYQSLHWYKAGTVFCEVLEVQEGIRSVCGNYRSPGFCQPDFSKPAPLSYNSEASPDAIPGQVVIDPAIDPETKRLTGEIARMENIMEAVERERIFEEQAYAELQKMVIDYESGAIKPKGVEMTINYRPESWQYDAHSLSISYSCTRFLPDSSLEISSLELYGKLIDPVSFSILRASLATLEFETTE
jgi:hypothetical protein